MKIKNYEKVSFITTIATLLIITEICLYIFFCKLKITEYIELSTIVTGDNEVRVLVDNSERKALYNNSTFYINSHKTKYSVILDNGILWQKNNKKYYEMVLKVKLKDNHKNNDIVTVSLANKKINLIEAIIKTWGGD